MTEGSSSLFLIFRGSADFADAGGFSMAYSPKPRYNQRSSFLCPRAFEEFCDWVQGRTDEGRIELFHSMSKFEGYEQETGFLFQNMIIKKWRSAKEINLKLHYFPEKQGGKTSNPSLAVKEVTEDLTFQFKSDRVLDILPDEFALDTLYYEGAITALIPVFDAVLRKKGERNATAYLFQISMAGQHKISAAQFEKICKKLPTIQRLSWIMISPQLGEEEKLPYYLDDLREKVGSGANVHFYWAEQTLE